MKARLTGVILGGLLSVAMGMPAKSAEWTWGGYLGANYEDDRSKKRGEFDTYVLSIKTNMRVDEKISVASQIDFEHGPFHDISNSAAGAKSLDQRSSGEIALSRAYGQYDAARSLKVRAGKFFTPLGVYNELLYAVPSYPFLKVPGTSVNRRSGNTAEDGIFFQRYAQGLWLSGDRDFGENNASYDFYVSNGRAHRLHEDSSASKAVGARLRTALPLLPVKLTPQLSGYYDKFDSRTGAGTVAVFKAQRSMIPGIEMEAGNLVAKGEYAYTEINTESTGVKAVEDAFYADVYYTYLDAWTPYFRYEYFEPNKSVTNDREREATLGMAYHLKLWQALAKAQFRYKSFEDPTKKPVQVWGLGLALAF